MCNLKFFKKTLYTLVLTILIICSIANFYRNRDPYRSYFHVRNDLYMTTHLLDSDFNHDCLELEYRLSNRVGTHFFKALKELYPNKQFIISETYLFDKSKLKEATGNEILISSNVPEDLHDYSIDSLLNQAQYSYFYSPFIYSSINQRELYTKTQRKDYRSFSSKEDRCFSYKYPWTKDDFPILIVLLPNKFPDSPLIRILKIGKYLFFIPSQHSILKFTK